MYFAINHKIHNRVAFWRAMEKINKHLPHDVFNYAILPNLAKDEAITIWEAPGQLLIEQLIEEQTDEFSRNVYLQIDENSAVCLK